MSLGDLIRADQLGQLFLCPSWFWLIDLELKDHGFYATCLSDGDMVQKVKIKGCDTFGPRFPILAFVLGSIP